MELRSTQSEPSLRNHKRRTESEDRRPPSKEEREWGDGVTRSAHDSTLWQEPGNVLGMGNANMASRTHEPRSPAPATGSTADSIGYKQLLRMEKALDEVLDGRTGILNELDMLRISRSLLETSLDQLDSTLAVLSRPGPTLTQSSPTVVPSEHHATNAESPSTIANNNLLARAPLPASQLSSYPSADRVGESASSVETMIVHLRQNLERVREQERAFSVALQSLSSKEYGVNEMQKRLASALKTPATKHRMADQMLLSNETALLPNPESPRPASDVPSIVQQYFDRCGDIGVWLERRDELLEAWAEGAAERELIADRGDELEVTDEEYDQTYQEREAYIERELADVREQADHLRSLCLAGDHDIERYKTRRRSLTSYGSSEILSPPHQVASAIARQPAKRISSWLQAVPLNSNEIAEERPEPITEEPSAHLSESPVLTQTVSDEYQVPLFEPPRPSVEPDNLATKDSPPRVAIREFVAKNDELPTPLATAGLLNVTQNHSLLSPQSIEDHSPVPSVSATTTGDTAPTQLTLSRRGSEEPPLDSSPCEP